MNPSEFGPVIATLTSIPVVLAMVQAVKMTDFIPSRFMPLVSIVIGTALGGVAYLIVQDVLLIVGGLMAGLGASGLYDTITKPLQQDNA